MKAILIRMKGRKAQGSLEFKIIKNRTKLEVQCVTGQGHVLREEAGKGFKPLGAELISKVPYDADNSRAQGSP